MARVTPPDRLDRILDAAREAFATRGFAATTMEDIAQRVGISRSAIYSRFDSKETLFRGLVEGLIADVLPEAMPPLGNVPAPDALRRFIQVVMVRLGSGNIAFLPRLIIGEGQAFPDLVKFYHDHAITRVLGAIEAIIRHGVTRGEFTCANPALAARSVAGGMIFSALWRIVFEPVGAEPLYIEAMAVSHAEVLLKGLTARGELA
ncbi:TetR family transcriptional regulator [Novosphingobium sediminis]|uniref:TetR family transcriptional regulator n=1 Tax=Novosphingobium sediminis TaxID=707214 RepID=A0A512AL73_9SPHN|nr:TetR/AcrR family transcriptional regulator [Novosphingobium sediminis]GEO00462.1 TetR family transcriptional regulator [Novosphingobium sediminis]